MARYKRVHIKAQPTLSRINQARAKAAIISRYCFIGDIIITETSAGQILPGRDENFNTYLDRLINYRVITYNVEESFATLLSSIKTSTAWLLYVGDSQ